MNKETRKVLGPQIRTEQHMKMLNTSGQMNADEDLWNRKQRQRRITLFALFAVQTSSLHPRQSASICVNLRAIRMRLAALLRHFEENQSKCLSINRLHPAMPLFQSRPIKIERAIY